MIKALMLMSWCDPFSVPLTWTCLTSAAVWWTGFWWRGGGTGEESPWGKTPATCEERRMAGIQLGCSVLPAEDLVLGFSSGCAWGGDWPNAAVPSGSRSAVATLWQWTYRSSLGKIDDMKRFKLRSRFELFSLFVLRFEANHFKLMILFTVCNKFNGDNYTKIFRSSKRAC